jgi:ribosomal protein S12 methylthiotransferase accessory factor
LFQHFSESRPQSVDEPIEGITDKVLVRLSPLDLDSSSGMALLAQVRKVASPQVAVVASRLARVFVIGSPFAPGFCCVGGEVALNVEQAVAWGASRISVTGNGESLDAALVSCLAEAGDFLSQLERQGDVQRTGSPEALSISVSSGWIGDVIAGASRSIDWVSARHAVTGAPVLLPADICLRRPPEKRALVFPGPLSSGAAAGAGFEAAALRAVLELCERDAAMLWWQGGRRARGFSTGHPANKAAIGLVERLRMGATRRRTWLLDITTDIGVPVVAAVSVDPEGRGLACGLASRLDIGEAARAAVLELCQMEMSAPLAEAKRAEAGNGALNEADWRHLRRAAFSAIECNLLFPSGVTETDEAGSARDLEALIAQLADRDVPLFLFDMTRPDVDISVVRAVSPALQPFTAAVSTERLKRLQAKGLGVEAMTRNVPLM